MGRFFQVGPLIAPGLISDTGHLQLVAHIAHGGGPVYFDPVAGEVLPLGERLPFQRRAQGIDGDKAERRIVERVEALEGVFGAKPEVHDGSAAAQRGKDKGEDHDRQNPPRVAASPLPARAGSRRFLHLGPFSRRQAATRRPAPEYM